MAVYAQFCCCLITHPQWNRSDFRTRCVQKHSVVSSVTVLQQGLDRVRTLFPALSTGHNCQLASYRPFLRYRSDSTRPPSYSLSSIHQQLGISPKQGVSIFLGNIVIGILPGGIQRKQVRKVTNQGAAEDDYVLRCRVVIRIRKTVAVGEVAVHHPQFGCLVNSYVPQSPLHCRPDILPARPRRHCPTG